MDEYFAKDIAESRKLTRDWGREIQLGSGVFSIYRFRGRGTGISRRHAGFIEYVKSRTKFCTKSSYEGNYNSIGFAGFGEYIYPHGVKYEGNFKNGMFHGRGTLIYPLGQVIEGAWKNGKLISYIYKCSDDLEYSTPWRYCQHPDRRFQSEKLSELHAAGEEFLTNKQPTKTLKKGCYDTVDGYFDPKKKCVYKDEHLYIRHGAKTYYCKQKPDVIRVCTKKEEDLIRTNYRKSGDDTVGYYPELYEDWSTGKRSEIEAIKEKLNREPSVLFRTLSADISACSSESTQ